MSRFQILSLDGGGVRGAFGIGFLAEWERLTGAKAHDCFDLIAGTSTGAITAAAIACGETGEGMVEFYRRHAREIFTPREPYRPRSWIRPIYPLVNAVFRLRTKRDLGTLFQSRYCPKSLRHCLASGFEERTLSDARHARLIVPTVNLTQGRAYVFRTPHFLLPPIDETLHGTLQGSSRDPLIVDVLMAATAAPTYFPHAEVMGEVHADGGLWAVSPSVLALAEAMKIRQECEGDHCPPHFDTSDVHLMSVGTGSISYSLQPPGADAGALFWASHSADVMSVSQVQGVYAPLRFLLAERYFAVNFDVPDRSWSLDGVEHVEALFERGREEARRRVDLQGGVFADHRATRYGPEPEPLVSAAAGAANRTPE